MVESQVGKVESLIKELVNKVMLEAMDIVDSSIIDDSAPSPRRLSINREYPASRQSNVRKNRSLSLRGARLGHERATKNFPYEGNLAILSTNPRSREDNFMFDVDQRASEEIRKIVQGLQGVQIGDVSSVQPVAKMSTLEREVKRAVQEMSASNEAPPPVAGHGDVADGIVEVATPTVNVEEVEYDAKDSSSPMFETVESSVDKHTDDNQRQMQWQAAQQEDVSKLRSSCFLHRMIKELENAEASQENVLRSCTSISGISQERIAAWEESEEKFIRTIEGSKYEEEENGNFEGSPLIMEEPLAISMLDDVPAGCIVEVEIEELDSRSAMSTPPPLPPSSESTSQCADAKKKSKTLPQEDTMLEKSKSKNKKSLGQRFRRFFRTAFKRSKDC